MVMIHPPGPPDAADTGQPLKRNRSSQPHNLAAASFDSVHELLDQETVAAQGTRTQAAATAAVAIDEQDQGQPHSHADAAMNSTRAMSGMRIFSRAALLVVAMGGGAALAVVAFYTTRAPTHRPGNHTPVEQVHEAAPANQPVQLETQPAAEPATVAAPESTAATSSAAAGDLPVAPPLPTATVESAPPVATASAVPVDGLPVPVAVTAPPESEPSVRLARLHTALKPMLPTSNAPASTVPKPPRIIVDVPARLSDPIGKLHLPKASLKSTLRLLSSISTIPMTIDASALRYGIRPESQVSVSADQASVADVLKQSMAPLKLKSELISGQVSVVHISQGRTELREVAHHVADLVITTPTSDLARFVTQLVDGGRWQPAGGPAQLVAEGDQLLITQTHRGHLEIALLLDQIRTARGLPPSGRFADAVVQIDLPWRAAEKRLAERITLRHEKPIRLGRVVEQLEQQADMNVLVDWQHLIEEGWNQATTVAVDQWQQPAAMALGQVVSQMGAAYRVVNDNTVMITTVAAEREMPDRAFFPVDDLLDAGHDVAEIITLTKQAVGLASFREQGGGGSLVYEPISQHLIVQLPQSELRIVAQVMANWRKL